MAYSLKIWMDHVVCRDPESLNGRDNFALMGGVIVDGTWVPFVLDPISITPTMGRQSWPLEQSQVFNGWMHNREIGLVLRGYDIDNNSAWKRERDEIKKTMGLIATGVDFVPLVGGVAAKILKAWPLVVDGIVSLDRNDLLLNYSSAVTLPDVPFTNTRGRSHPVEVRFKRTDPTGYSDWDYSLHISFAYVNNDIPSFGGERAEHTRHARKDSKAPEWVGRWVSERVTCDIAPSSGRPGLLDVYVTEGGRGAGGRTEHLGVSITPPSDIRVVEAPPRVVGRSGGGSLERAGGSSLGRAGGGSLERAGVPSVRGEPIRVVGRPGAGGQTRSLESRIERVPERKRTGADRLTLSNDAVLEIYALRDRGRPTPLRALRYVRPYSRPQAALQVDEYLQWVPML